MELVSRKPWTLLSALLLGVALIVWFFRSRLMNLMPPCYFHRYTSLHCPGCGGRRCVTAVGQGRFFDALHMNALVVVLVAAAVLLLGRQVWREWRFGNGGIIDISSRSGWLIAWGIIAFWVLRNVPIWPFTLLAPF
jgi:Protein of unknown function (DUF2752)